MSLFETTLLRNLSCQFVAENTAFMVHGVRIRVGWFLTMFIMFLSRKFGFEDSEIDCWSLRVIQQQKPKIRARRTGFGKFRSKKRMFSEEMLEFWGCLVALSGLREI